MFAYHVSSQLTVYTITPTGAKKITRLYSCPVGVYNFIKSFLTSFKYCFGGDDILLFAKLRSKHDEGTIKLFLAAVTSKLFRIGHHFVT